MKWNLLEPSFKYEPFISVTPPRLCHNHRPGATFPADGILVQLAQALPPCLRTLGCPCTSAAGALSCPGQHLCPFIGASRMLPELLLPAWPGGWKCLGILPHWGSLSQGLPDVGRYSPAAFPSSSSEGRPACSSAGLRHSATCVTSFPLCPLGMGFPWNTSYKITYPEYTFQPASHNPIPRPKQWNKEPEHWGVVTSGHQTSGPLL